ncbi:MAG: hypothetical protein DSM107014_11635 [Gomphosphaeria aponina SAG 52.96 = DSM 107014]|uniref:Uncharacterized protein n=1 Tax=Gomphosphaeria aponina SAG 52.96 = DSM 107014 TaxID=1521640 RepID=A0A941GS88_9CHRO|nr:hypothetical protein [Gomphosphaeria aponina SAG 52.96 = DSM 107014]
MPVGQACGHRTGCCISHSRCFRQDFFYPLIGLEGLTFLNKIELEEILAEAYAQALDNANLEVFGGIYEAMAKKKNGNPRVNNQASFSLDFILN